MSYQMFLQKEAQFYAKTGKKDQWFSELDGGYEVGFSFIHL